MRALPTLSALLSTLLALAAPLLAQTPASAPAASRPQAGKPREVRGIAYVTGEGVNALHQLDLYLPSATPERKPPLVMFVHGGAWRAGDRRPYGALGRMFAERGIACAAINYRLSPAVQHPAHVEDCARAFRWIADHAGEYGYDRERLFLCGHSAGGHLTALLATDPRYLNAVGLKASDVRGAIPISGAFDLSGEMELIEQAFGKDPAVRRDASPARHVSKAAPPFLVLWGDNDMTGLALAGRSFARALERAGVPVESAEIEERTHATIVSRLTRREDPAMERIVAFVERWSRKTAEPDPAAGAGGK